MVSLIANAYGTLTKSDPEIAVIESLVSLFEIACKFERPVIGVRLKEDTPYFAPYVFHAPDSLWVRVQRSLTEPSLSIFVT
jgi:hypothetical protein